MAASSRFSVRMTFNCPEQISLNHRLLGRNPIHTIGFDGCRDAHADLLTIR